MDAKTAAATLDGCEYGSDGSREIWAEMKAAGLVALFGYSDDTIEMRGDIDDEIGAVDTLYFRKSGVVRNRCDSGDCPHFWEAVNGASEIEIGSGKDGGMFSFVTDIPHHVFHVMEDGELYSAGIVFALADCAS